MLKASIIVFSLSMCATCATRNENQSITVGIGRMPNIATETSGNAHLVYGSGDSIFYANAVKGN